MRVKIWLFSILLFFVFSIAYFVSNEKDGEFLEVVFLDVGQGDSVLIKTPNRKEVLIDAGRDSKMKRSLSKKLPFYDHRIDISLATHLDEDHMGGFQDFFKGYTSDLHIYVSTSTKINEVTDSLWNSLDDKGIMMRKVMAGDRIVLDEEREIYLDVLYPTEESFGKGSENDNSVVMKLVYGNTSFLFTGDISGEIEKKMVFMYGEQLQSDVLKVAHHGSNDSSESVFIQAVKPIYSVISSGEGNRYGHPHAQVIQRLEEENSEIFNTKDEGNISFVSDGKDIFRVD